MSFDRLDIRTGGPTEFHDITDVIEDSVAASGVAEGICYIFSPHTTAGLTINENADPGVQHDILHALDRAVPERDPAYRHISENSAAHVKACMMGFSLFVPVSGGRLSLGRWQAIYLCEFDGPRTRHVHVRVLA